MAYNRGIESKTGAETMNGLFRSYLRKELKSGARLTFGRCERKNDVITLRVAKQKKSVVRSCHGTSFAAGEIPFRELQINALMFN